MASRAKKARGHRRRDSQDVGDPLRFATDAQSMRHANTPKPRPAWLHEKPWHSAAKAIASSTFCSGFDALV